MGARRRKLTACLLAASVSVFQYSQATPPQEIAPRNTNKTAQVSEPVRVVFDSDMWSDIDDMLALAMLHALQDRHEVNILAVTITTKEPWSASYVDLVDTFYLHPDIPVGLVGDGVTPEATLKKFDPKNAILALRKMAYVQSLSERRNPDGSRVYPHCLLDGSTAPEAVALLRKTLAAQPDDSVVMIQVGFSTNFAHLLDSPPDTVSSLDGAVLVKKKVRFLSVMAGDFSGKRSDGRGTTPGRPEFNLMLDVPSSRKLFERWPTPIVVSGFEIGSNMLFPAKSIEDEFTYVHNHPIAESYRYYSVSNSIWPHDHATFDLTSVLYAARPGRNYFSLSKPGKIAVMPDGSAKFEEVDGGLHRYLILDAKQNARTLEAMVMLTSQPPAHGRASRCVYR